MDSWSTHVLAEALRKVLHRVEPTDGYQPVSVVAHCAEIRLSFTLQDDPATYLVVFPAEPPLLGESTGEPCRSPEEWAFEVWTLLDEEIGTRSVDHAKRSAESDGLVRLHL